MNFEYESEFIKFVRSLNKPEISSLDAIEKIHQKREEIKDPLLVDLLFSCVYDWLWVEPASLAARREGGELDYYFRGSSRSAGLGEESRVCGRSRI